MKKKTVAILGSVAIVVILVGVIMIVMMGGGEPSIKQDLPTMDEIPSETIHFEPTSEVMIPDEGEVFWPIHGPTNSTEVIMITGIQVHVTWSDDESAPARKPLYENMPDTMSIDIVAKPYLQSLESDGNDTSNGTMTSSSDAITGTVRIDMDLKASPVLLEEGPDTNISFDPAGSADGGNTGLYIKISCLAGDIEKSMPALRVYPDRGDEVTMTVTITVKKVPVEVFEAWVEEQTQSTEW
jgi:hypothetical protein